MKIVEKNTNASRIGGRLRTVSAFHLTYPQRQKEEEEEEEVITRCIIHEASACWYCQRAPKNKNQLLQRNSTIMFTLRCKACKHLQ